MNKLILILVALASLIMAAKADIGWTLDECKSHYGPFTTRVSKNFGYSVYDFTAGGLHITCILDDDNKVAAVDYSKVNGDVFSDAEIADIQNRNGGASIWSKTEPSEYNEIGWRTKTGPLIWQVESADHHVLMFATDEQSHRDSTALEHTALQDETCDFTQFYSGQLKELAQIDGMEYAKSHPAKNDYFEIGYAKALKHHLLGNDATGYAVDFDLAARTSQLSTK